MEQRALGEEFNAASVLGVSIILPCLNERDSLPHCVANARDALSRIHAAFGLEGEIVIADNGSTDGSQAIAEALGARVVAVVSRGYGAALIGGCESALGSYLLMGDADGSYDFTDGVAMIGELIKGADLCMGSRFKGGIAPGAMPWKNRYIGNPALTGILNLFFRAGIDDAHCGLRALTRECFHDLGLRGRGMEFASEMVIKAALTEKRITQVPATLSKDLRDRPPHLRPWRDGWRHLRYLLMLSPTWVFGVPALLAMLSAAVIIGALVAQGLGWLHEDLPFGASWTIAGGFLFSVGHVAGLMALATHFHGVRRGYRRLRPALSMFRSWFTLESVLLIGGCLIAAALAGFVAIGLHWSAHGYAALPSVLPVTLAALAGAVGLQTVFGGFLLAIIGEHDAQLLPATQLVMKVPA